MLFRFISRRYHFRLPILPSHQTHLSNPTKSPINLSRIPPFPSPTFKFFPRTSQFFSTNNNHGNSPLNPGPDTWKLSSETDEAVFGEDSGSLEGMGEGGGTDGQTSSGNDGSWLGKSSADDTEGDIFRGVEDGKGMEGGGIDLPGGNDDGWGTVEPWDLGGDGKEEVNVFDINEGELEELHGIRDDEGLDGKKKEEDKLLEMEEKSLTAVLKGPNRAFGDLMAASGITEAMMDSLIALKDFENIEGLPPLSEIEDIRYEKNIKKSTRAEIERQKQEEVAKSRVRQVDTKGRAYGTGKRKCSIARVWIQPGDGKFIVNDKQFDVYFPMLDHRAALLRPFSETKTLGLWDVNCTVKGGGVSGQVGAILLGISRAMQNWEPELRPPLRSAGFLTRDSRVVERKKPGKAKARKSFQWVKR